MISQILSLLSLCVMSILLLDYSQGKEKECYLAGEFDSECKLFKKGTRLDDIPECTKCCENFAKKSKYPNHKYALLLYSKPKAGYLCECCKNSLVCVSPAGRGVGLEMCKPSEKMTLEFCYRCCVIWAEWYSKFYKNYTYPLLEGERKNNNIRCDCCLP